MKKIILWVILSIFTFTANIYADSNVRYWKEITCTASDKAKWCDQCFESRTLRYWNVYTLMDYIHNVTPTDIYIDEFQYKIDKWLEMHWQDNLNLEYTDWIVNKDYIVKKWESWRAVEMKWFEINYLPFWWVRAKDNVYIRYIASVQNYVNWQAVWALRSHTECQPYEITWCGDGILDPEETCDPKDPTKKGWWIGWCDKQTCKPIVKNSTCNLLKATPTTWVWSLTTNFTCEWINVTNFKIDIKNGANIINTINGKTWSFTFTNPGTYVATCFADNKTSASCEQVITVKQKLQGQCTNLEVSKVNAEKWETVKFTCNATNTNNYKIKIVDEKGGIVKEIFGKTWEFTFPEKGTYIASCYVDDKTTTENTCVKPVKVSDPIIPKIDVDKTDKNTNDKDWRQENDTQTIDVKDPAVFKITVTNNGTEELKDIFLKDDVIESDVDAPKCEKTIEEVNQILQTKFWRTTFKPGESFDYTCERVNEARDPETYTNKITVEGKGVISLKGVKDEDPTKVIKSKEPKIKVDKTDKNPVDTDWTQENDTQTIEKKGTAVFKITVTNNWTEDLKNVFLKDDVLKSDVDATSCDKSIDEVNNILKTIGNKDEIFNIGETFDYTCERKNVTSDVFPYTNKIDVTWIWINSGKTVKDEDTTVVKIWKDTCEGLDVTQKSWNPWFTSEFTCKWSWNKFEIFVKDNSGKILEKFDSKTGKFTFNNKWNYTVECYNDNKTSDACKVPVKVEDKTSGGGGNSPVRCEHISPRWTIEVSSFPYTREFTCKMSGWNNVELYINGERKDFNTTGNFKYTFEKSWTYTVECKSNGIINNSDGSCQAIIKPSTWGWSTPGGGSSSGGGNWRSGWSNPPYCGDGKVQRPSVSQRNKDKFGTETIMEECDSTSTITYKDANGNEKTERYCNERCELAIDPLTIPWEQYFKFGPNGIDLIWANMNPYHIYEKPFVQNKSRQDDIYLWQLCIKNVKWDTFNVNDGLYCETIKVDWYADGILPAWKTFRMTMSNKNTALSKKYDWNDKFKFNILSTHVRKADRNGNYPDYSKAAFYSNFRKSFENTGVPRNWEIWYVVRVAKGSVSTIWGWVSYLDNSNKDKISNAKDITNSEQKNITNIWNKINNNSNFVWASLTDFLTSYSKNINSWNAVDKAKEDINNINKIKTSVTISNNWNTYSSSNDDLWKFSEYNWITWAKIVKNQNIRISSLPKLDVPTTYIIENWNLFIDWNIDADVNVAFVVKWWNIKFAKKVTYAEGTYVAISYGKDLGKITSDETPSQLVVSGALYWNISELTKNRTYLRVNENWQLDTGTVVNYGSSAFRKPAPLVGTFIQEYMNSTKVAQ